eukprot:TRINITY_DN9152_c0_g1_i2.p1 TRINITY_DN9152_c0_g1~~TRINITY_DN9152_c0_g1_i2.p1  ORF type:complete len:466 (-),score=38.49 TRINITY_DN9152_c0_g1_i2:533-1930(-)
MEKIGRTALLIAAGRALESGRPDSLFEDKYAHDLAGTNGYDFLEALADEGTGVADQVDKIAVRTRFLDDAILRVEPDQVVLIGVGADTRAFRLPFSNTVRVFELDLPGVCEYRQERLRGLTPCCTRLCIACDVTNASWVTTLCDAGFSPKRTSVFVVEGLLMYLSSSQASLVMQQIAALLSPSSRVVGNILGGDCVDRWQQYYETWRKFAPSPSLAFRCPSTFFSDCGLAVDLVPLGSPRANFGRLPVTHDPADSFSGVLMFVAAPRSPHPVVRILCAFLALVRGLWSLAAVLRFSRKGKEDDSCEITNVGESDPAMAIDCSCFYTSNIFVHSVHRHFTFTSEEDFEREEAEFLHQYTKGDRKKIGVLITEIRSEIALRRSTQMRRLQNRAKICAEYVPLYPALRTLDLSCFAPTFLNAIAEPDRAVANGEVTKVAPGFRSRSPCRGLLVSILHTGFLSVSYHGD